MFFNIYFVISGRRCHITCHSYLVKFSMLLLNLFTLCIALLSFFNFSYCSFVWDQPISSINSEILKKISTLLKKCALVNRTVIACLFSHLLTFHPSQLVALFLCYVFSLQLLTTSFIFLLIFHQQIFSKSCFLSP